MAVNISFNFQSIYVPLLHFIIKYEMQKCFKMNGRYTQVCEKKEE